MDVFFQCSAALIFMGKNPCKEIKRFLIVLQLRNM